MTETPVSNLTQRQRYWLDHIQACKRAGLSFRAYARSNNLNHNNLYTAHHKLKQKGVISEDQGTPKFQKLDVKPAARAPFMKVTCPNGFVVEFHGEMGAASLLQIVSAIQ